MAQQKVENYHNYTCTLTKELLEKAKRELNEDPNTRKLEIQALRERLLKYPGLTPQVDDAFLLKFLRARKFDQERTFHLLQNYYQMKKDNEEIYAQMTPKKIKHILDAGVTYVWPHRSKCGEAIILFHPGRWDAEKYPLMDVFRNNFIVLSSIIESEEIQVNGIRMFIDLSEMSWTHAKHISPFMAKKISALLQDAFPMRLKGIHYIHQPGFFDTVFQIMKPFLKEKLRQRLHFHGEKVEQLHDFVDPDLLPEEYKGKKPNVSQEQFEGFCKHLIEKDSEFEECAKFGFVSMTMNQTSKKSVDAMENLPGTFKKLNVD